MNYTYTILEEQGEKIIIRENESCYYIYFPTLQDMIQNPHEYNLTRAAERKSFDRILSYVKKNYPEELI